MARTFSQEIADHYKVAVDLAVHDPRPSGDPRNFHAHLLLTTREVSAAGLGPKTGLDLQTSERIRLGLPNISQEFTAIRERWATLTNEALKDANIEARVDHRSLAEQGIDREPKPHIPFAAFKIERAGKYSEVAESIRADYNAKVQARQERAADRIPEPTPGSTLKSLEDIRREARETWLKMRAEQTAESADQSTAASAANASDQPHASGTHSASASTYASPQPRVASSPAPHPHDTPSARQAHHTHNTPTPDNDYQP
jgi:hypothetical protein